MYKFLVILIFLFVSVLTVFAFIIYPSLGLLMTPNVNDLKTITDEIGSRRKRNGMKLDINYKEGKCVCKDKEQCWKEYYELGSKVTVKKRIPILKDLDMWDVSEHLYL